jgi:hypothetical protein
MIKKFREEPSGNSALHVAYRNLAQTSIAMLAWALAMMSYFSPLEMDKELDMMLRAIGLYIVLIALGYGVICMVAKYKLARGLKILFLLVMSLLVLSLPILVFEWHNLWMGYYSWLFYDTTSKILSPIAIVALVVLAFMFKPLISFVSVLGYLLLLSLQARLRRKYDHVYRQYGFRVRKRSEYYDPRYPYTQVGDKAALRALEVSEPSLQKLHRDWRVRDLSFRLIWILLAGLATVLFWLYPVLMMVG